MKIMTDKELKKFRIKAIIAGSIVAIVAVVVIILKATGA